MKRAVKRRRVRIAALNSVSSIERLEPRQMLSVNVTTYHYSNAETGANTNETVLTPANVNTSTFGKVASLSVDGQIYGQPLIMTGIPMTNGQGTHDIVLVTTENDSVYAFDAYGNNPAQGYLWKTSLLQTGETTVPETDYGTTDITPQLGITGTPVINPATNTLYVVGLFKESNATYQQRIYALNVSSGANAIAPVTITASVPGTGYDQVGNVITFNTFRENQRPALTLANGDVYVGWSSHGDQNPWHGWLIAYNAATLHEDYAYCDTANGEQGGIWMSGGGIAVDSSGNLYFSTGNGTFDAGSGGADYSMAIEELSPSLTPEQYFAPYNQASLSNADLDYGCSNVILLSGQGGSYPNEVLSAGKWGTIYLNNEAALGGYNSNGSGPNTDLGEATLAGANTSTSNVHNTMVYWNGSVYLGGDALTLQAFSVANGVLGTTPTSQTSHVFGSTSVEDGQGAGLTVSSNGSTNGIVWALDNTGFLTTPAVLYAYNASNLSGTPLWTSNSSANNRDVAGIAIKFQDPVVANGHVYIAGYNSVTVYGAITASTATPTLVTPAAANPSTVTGTTTSLSVLGSDPPPDLSPTYKWVATTIPSGATTPTFSVNGTNNANVSTATFFKAGAYTFTVTLEDPNSGFTYNSSVSVTVNQTLTSTVVSPATATLNDGGTQQFSVSGYDQFGIAMTNQPAFTWSVTPGGVGGSVSFGLYTAPSTGSGTDTVNATTGSFVASAAAIVNVPQTTTQLNLSSYFNKVGIVADGSTFTGGIDGSGSALSGTLLGTTQTYNSSTFTIAPPVTGNTTNNVLSASGQTIPVAAGKYSTLKILGLRTNGAATETFVANYADGSTQPITQGFSDWFNYTAYTGQAKELTMHYRDLAAGTTDNRTFYLYGYILSLSGTKILSSITLPGDAQVQILAMDTVGLLSPTVTLPAGASPSPVTGTTTGLSVAGSDAAGDASPVYSWAATNVPSGAITPAFSINNSSSASATTATFYQAGAYTFTATIKDPTNGLTATSSVNVTVNQTLSSIGVVPSTPTVYDAGTQQFTATAYDQFVAPMSSQPSFTWSVNGGGAGGSVNTSSGLYSAPSTGTGTDTLKATSGSTNGTATITVASANPTVTNPAAANPSPVTGTTSNLTVLGTDISGDANPTYNWVATNAPAGAITPIFSINNSSSASSTTATFYKAGAYTFTATIKDPTNGFTSTSSVNVTVNQTVTSILVTPTSPAAIYNGQTQQFSALADDQFGQVVSAQPTFTWIVLPTVIGSVDSTGLYHAPASGIGTANVQASSGTIAGQSSVQVAQPAWLGAGSAAVWNSATSILSVTGASSIIADPGSDQPVIQANGSSAVVTINPASALQIHIGGLSLTNGASAIVTSLGAARTATNHRVLILGLSGATSAPTFVIDSTSQLDLTDNDLIDHDGSFSSVNNLLTSGFNATAGYWNGSGIVSSTAAAGTLTTLGEARVTNPGNIDNEPVATSDLDVRYSYYGDATLDGHVDGSDYSRIDNGYVSGLSGFYNGDFNYDGVINGSDYTLIDNAFNTQGASLAAEVATPAAQVAGTTKTAVMPAGSPTHSSNPTNVFASNLIALSAGSNTGQSDGIATSNPDLLDRPAVRFLFSTHSRQAKTNPLGAAQWYNAGT